MSNTFGFGGGGLNWLCLAREPWYLMQWRPWWALHPLSTFLGVTGKGASLVNIPTANAAKF